MREGTEGVVEGHPGLIVRRAPRRLETDLAEIRGRPVPELAPERMVGEPFDVLLEPPGVKPLEGSGNASVQFTALWLKKIAVDHLVGEGVGEGVFEIGKEALLVHKFGRLEMGEPATQDGLVSLRDLAQQTKWHVGPDDRGGLEQPF